MLTTLVILFVLAYVAIALEHPLGVNKSASALLGAGLLWTCYAVMSGDPQRVSDELGESLMGTAQIVFFLIGAMTIVEVVDAHDGFDVITSRIRTTDLSTLMWMVGFTTFFLSAILDNLTTTIVMVSLMRKLLAQREDRLLAAGGGQRIERPIKHRAGRLRASLAREMPDLRVSFEPSDIISRVMSFGANTPKTPGHVFHSGDAGKTWKVLKPNARNTGGFDWKVDKNFVTNQGQIRVCLPKGPGVPAPLCDVSDGRPIKCIDHNSILEPFLIIGIEHRLVARTLFKLTERGIVFKVRHPIFNLAQIFHRVPLVVIALNFDLRWYTRVIHQSICGDV